MQSCVWGRGAGSSAGRGFVTDVRTTFERVWALAGLLGQSDENALGASDVTEPIGVFVLDHFVDILRAVLAEPDERIVEIVYGERDAEVAEGVN